ncbi:hypothetical protein [uncultured Selenomonas sp.]|uniref:hypothetical protein n=1 Tax=uncultured Selenomonas sp. TaxID=159275 RepID=UPI0026002680|nr:hypothetical protein [uncultured Selenomonas sp.]
MTLTCKTYQPVDAYTRGILKKLLDYQEDDRGEQPIVVVAPVKSPAHSMRVYAHGALIGAIPVNPSYYTNSRCKFFDPNYLKSGGLFLTDDDHAILERIDHSDDLSTDKEIFQSAAYLNLACKAAKARWNGKEPSVSLERDIETAILKYNWSHHDHWVISDMEYNLEQHAGKMDYACICLEGSAASQLCLMELKANASACMGKSGLAKHYQDMREHFDALPTIRQTIVERYNRLIVAGLLPGKQVEEIPDDLPLLFGFLFHKGERLQTQADAVRLCAQELRKVTPDFAIDARLRFLFLNNVQEKTLDQMQTWEAFSHTI